MKWGHRILVVATLGMSLFSLAGCAEDNEDKLKKEMAGQKVTADQSPPPKVEKVTPPTGYPGANRR